MNATHKLLHGILLLTVAFFSACSSTGGKVAKQTETKESDALRVPEPSPERDLTDKLFSKAIHAYFKEDYVEVMKLSQEILGTKVAGDQTYLNEAEQMLFNARLRLCKQALKRAPSDENAKLCIKEVYQRFPSWK